MRKISRDDIIAALSTLGATSPDKAVRGAVLLAELARMKSVDRIAPAAIGFVKEYTRDFYDAKRKLWALGAGRPQHTPPGLTHTPPEHGDRARNFLAQHSGLAMPDELANAFQLYLAAYGEQAAREWAYATFAELSAF